jgi:Acetyltransferase (GNAT) domain
VSSPSSPEHERFVVRPFERGDEQSVVALLQRAFGRWPRGVDDVTPGEFFEWKHQSSPFGPSQMLVAARDSQMVGFIARMPWRLSVGGELRAAARVVDIAVEPSVHRRGLAMQLIGTPSEHYGPEVALSWSNPNEQSRRSTEKAGLHRVAIHQYVGIDGKRVFAHALGQGRPLAPAPGEHADALLADDALLARALDARADVRSITTAIDERFVRWRYGRFGAYRALAVHDRRGRTALAIFRVSRHGRWSVAHVCELFVQERLLALARRAFRAVRRASSADVVVVAGVSSATARAGALIRSPRDRAISVNPLHERIALDPTRASSWRMSLGDLELV